MWLSAIIAFNMGLLSSVHCLGMCGGIITMLMKATANGNDASAKPLASSLAYNLGRISSYCIAGLIAGLFGAGLSALIATYQLHMWVQVFAAVILILLALSILNLFSFARLERLGQQIWNKVQPFSKRLLPVDSFRKALLFGMVWGWLPCGLVYSALLLGLTTGTVGGAVLVMFCFGLGTLPSMISAGFVTEQLQQYINQRQLRWCSAAMLILLAISLPFSTYYYAGHHDGHAPGNHTSSDTDPHSHHHH